MIRFGNYCCNGGRLLHVSLFLALVIFTTLIEFSAGHVSLTFPPARNFRLDFLNSFWTKPPCGMPKGRTRTSLIAGQPYNVTWHLGYAHAGGYHLELLDSKEQKILDLTNDFQLGVTTAQAHEVYFPANLTCQDCTIRLLRQVPEFSPNFFFWSCADVSIVKPKNYREVCSHKGKFVDGYCHCQRDYWGAYCQYKDECETDADCNVGGKCIYLDGTALPTKQCFCSPNYFGEKCRNANPNNMPKSPSQLKLTKHIPVPLSDRMTMYFKTKIGRTEDQDEIEFVLIANGTSFVALGWRPSDIGPTCKSWPFDPNANKIDIRARGKRQAQGQQYSQESVELNPVDYAEEPPQIVLHEYAAHDPFTPMDCSDIIIGTARNGRSRVRDYYSRGRHTPHVDSTWGGKDDLLGAVGWEKDGFTTIVFRRRAKTNDGPDHSIKDEMQLIWSRGQQPGEYVENISDRLQKDEAYVSPFYVVDELKYHGLGQQRGVLYINFTAARSTFLK